MKMDLFLYGMVGQKGVVVAKEIPCATLVSTSQGCPLPGPGRAVFNLTADATSLAASSGALNLSAWKEPQIGHGSML